MTTKLEALDRFIDICYPEEIIMDRLTLSYITAEALKKQPMPLVQQPTGGVLTFYRGCRLVGIDRRVEEYKSYKL